MQQARSALKSRFSKWKLKEEPSLKQPQGSRRQKLEQDIVICEAVEGFAEDFCRSLEGLMRVMTKFWELMQVLDREWLEQEDGLLQTHVWALRSGVGSITPQVFKQLQKHVKAVKAIAKKLHGHEEVFQARDKAWVEKEHYQRKLAELRSELSKRDQNGQAISQEQMERLQRNEAKNSRAQDEYDALHSKAQSYLEAKEKLKSTLCDVVRVVACGWFISTGATVCRAVAQAELARQNTARSSQAASQARGPIALEDYPRVRGLLEDPESLKPFDPADPFREPWFWDDEERGSEEGGEAPAAPRSWVEEEECVVWTQDDLENLSEEALRQRLADQGLGIPPWCADRQALLELARVLESRASPSSTAAPGTGTFARRPSSSSQLGVSPAQTLDEATPSKASAAASPELQSPLASPQADKADAGGNVECALAGFADEELRAMLADLGASSPADARRPELLELLLRSQVEEPR